ncbi:MAG: hypothetical protein HFI69_04320 [Lachnospiraceae bacterium]|nr:hypothetical protein [Lachnospiraceae bacterium]
MNLLFRSPASMGSSNARCLKCLDDKIHFDKCVVVEQSLDGMDVYRGKKYIKIDAQVGYKNLYSSVIDLDVLPALDKDILEKMEAYKSTCLNMAMRNYSLYIGNYYELEKEYLSHLKYWNYILDSNQIDLVFMSVIPHCMWEYVIYALAQCKKIRTLLISSTAVPGLNAVGTSIENLGENVIASFFEQNELKETVLHDIVSEYYQCTNQKNTNLMFSGRKEQPYNDRFLYRTYYKPLLNGILHSTNDIKKRILDLQLFGKVAAQKIFAKSIDYYNKRAGKPAQERFVYFALQVTPEMTTLPWAGVFQNQLLSIRILANGLAKCGIKLYVKEHYQQPAVRPKTFYDELFTIPNVVCIKTDVEAYDLINQCVAVASQTGSCIIESILKKKPVLALTKGFWDCLNNVFVVGCEEDVIHSVNEIESGNARITDEDVKRYLLALENSLVRMNLDLTETPQVSAEMAQTDLCDLISQYIESNAGDHFYYKRTPEC